jgi:hypothetical protein
LDCSLSALAGCCPCMATELKEQHYNEVPGCCLALLSCYILVLTEIEIWSGPISHLATLPMLSCYQHQNSYLSFLRSDHHVVMEPVYKTGNLITVYKNVMYVIKYFCIYLS